jgi:hypothetical protein
MIMVHDPYSALVRHRQRLCPNSAWTTTQRHRSWTASRHRLQQWFSGTSSRLQHFVPRNGENEIAPQDAFIHKAVEPQHPSLECWSTLPQTHGSRARMWDCELPGVEGRGGRPPAAARTRRHGWRPPRGRSAARTSSQPPP